MALLLFLLWLRNPRVGGRKTAACGPVVPRNLVRLVRDLDGRPGSRVVRHEVVGLRVGGYVRFGDLYRLVGVVGINNVVLGGQDLDVDHRQDSVDNVIFVDFASDLLVGDVVLDRLDELVSYRCASISVLGSSQKYVVGVYSRE